MKRFRTKSLTLLLFLGLAIVGVSFFHAAPAHAYNNNDLIDNSVFDNTGSMSTVQIQAFLNQFPNSCIKNYQAPDPQSWSTYGSMVSAAQVIKDASTIWQINPKVLLTTMEKEEGLIRGDGAYGCNATSFWSSMGYNCPGSATYTYTTARLTNASTYSGGIPSDMANGAGPTCAAQAQNVGFSAQVSHGAWQLAFGRHRSEGDGNLSWDGDNAVPYYGYMTAGTRPRVQGGTVATYSGIVTLNDNNVVTLSNGATASLYSYTPYIQSFDTIFEGFFGAGSTTGAEIIEAPGDSRLFVLDGNVKHWISTTETYNAWGFTAGQTLQVSQAYFDSFATGAELTRYSTDPNNNLYYVDNGYKHWVPSGTYEALWGIPSNQIVPSTAMLNLLPEAEWIGRFAKSEDGTQLWLIDGTTKYQLNTITDAYHWGLTPNNYTFLSSDALGDFTTGASLGEDISYNGNNFVVDASNRLLIPNQQTATSWGINSFTPIGAMAPGMLTNQTTASNFVRDPSVGAWYMLTAGQKRYITTAAIASGWGLNAAGQSLTNISTNLMSAFTAGANLSVYVVDATSGKYYVIDNDLKNWLPDANTANAWLPNGTTPPTYDSNSLARLTEVNASTIVQPNNSSNVFTLDHGSLLYIQTGAILGGWGYPRIASIERISSGLAASLPSGGNASQRVTNGTTTYLLDNGYLYTVPSGLAGDWAATSPITVTQDALNRFTAASGPVTSLITVNGTSYAVSGGSLVNLGGYSGAYGVNNATATTLTQLPLPVSSNRVSYIAQSTTSSDPRMWLIANGTKYYFDSFARLVSYGFISNNVPVIYLSQSFLDGMSTSGQLAPLCIQKAGSGFKYLNFGTALGFPDNASVAAYCGSSVAVTPAIYDSFTVTKNISQVIQDDSGKIYFVSSGTKHWITSSTTYNSQYKSYPVLYLYGTTIALIPDGTPIN
jgi:hypothetical protein